jgi:hypothetical protein
MKRFIFLAAIIIGVAGFASAETDARQGITPEIPCISTDQVYISAAVVAPEMVYVISIPECATVPVVVDNVANKCTGFVWQIIKPPEFKAVNFQATLTNNLTLNSRDWVTHRSHLAMKTKFLEQSVRNLPVPFD